MTSVSALGVGLSILPPNLDLPQNTPCCYPGCSPILWLLHRHEDLVAETICDQYCICKCTFQTEPPIVTSLVHFFLLVGTSSTMYPVLTLLPCSVSVSATYSHSGGCPTWLLSASYGLTVLQLASSGSMCMYLFSFQLKQSGRAWCGA